MKRAQRRGAHVGLLALILVLTASACSTTPEGPLPPPPEPTSTDALVAQLEESDAPVVVNVWASWCHPCRTEASLIAAATNARPGVRFIGLNVRDNPSGAQEFMATYLSDADMEHFSDRSGRIPIDLGGSAGVPLTFFYRPHGELAHVHIGIIDEPALALALDEIDR